MIRGGAKGHKKHNTSLVCKAIAVYHLKKQRDLLQRHLDVDAFLLNNPNVNHVKLMNWCRTAGVTSALHTFMVARGGIVFEEPEYKWIDDSKLKNLDEIPWEYRTSYDISLLYL